MLTLSLKIILTSSLFGSTSTFTFYSSNQRKFSRQINNPFLLSKTVSNGRYDGVTSKYITPRDDIPEFAFHNTDDDNIDDEDDENDWRAFRARLVAMEHDQDEQNYENVPYDDSFIQIELEQNNATQVRDLKSVSHINEKQHVTKSWAFESGSIVEQGTVLLYHPPDPQEEFGFGLGKQYLHKSAVLILDHSETNTRGEITKGVILNRPTDLIIDDVVTNPETNEKKAIKWKIWYGGELRGIHSDAPKYFFNIHC